MLLAAIARLMPCTPISPDCRRLYRLLLTELQGPSGTIKIAKKEPAAKKDSDAAKKPAAAKVTEYMDALNSSLTSDTEDRHKERCGCQRCRTQEKSRCAQESNQGWGPEESNYKQEDCCQSQTYRQHCQQTRQQTQDACSSKSLLTACSSRCV